MKKVFFILTAFVGLTAFTVSNHIWTNDDAHSELSFQVKHLGISEVSGFFKDFDVVIESQKADFSDAVVKLTVRATSLDTRVTMRDDHLRSADFFDVAKYPTITFTSTEIKATDDKNEYDLYGNLTILGVTKKVKMEMEYNGTITNPQSKKETAGFKFEGKIKRSDFGVGPKFPPPMISDEVEIKAHGEFIKS